MDVDIIYLAWRGQKCATQYFTNKIPHHVNIHHNYLYMCLIYVNMQHNLSCMFTYLNVDKIILHVDIYKVHVACWQSKVHMNRIMLHADIIHIACRGQTYSYIPLPSGITFLTCNILSWMLTYLFCMATLLCCMYYLSCMFGTEVCPIPLLSGTTYQIDNCTQLFFSDRC